MILQEWDYFTWIYSSRQRDDVKKGACIFEQSVLEIHWSLRFHHSWDRVLTAGVQVHCSSVQRIEIEYLNAATLREYRLYLEASYRYLAQVQICLNASHVFLVPPCHATCGFLGLHRRRSTQRGCPEFSGIFQVKTPHGLANDISSHLTVLCAGCGPRGVVLI